ncbi:DUF5320 domain-containing protein [Methanofollis ethanolicus]|uniref:DUF5320 domain-containing protein n=1 Tax=Methanofollis ethanolicus TaxID=488124 RepID=UPI001F38FBE4|nr:DUF5320 domain-containing protein [Methanofollis ethanolicus]
MSTIACKGMVNDMPGYDGTGPRGCGQMTGGRRGPCMTARPAPVESGDATAPEQNNVLYGLGRGGIPCGCGRGHGNGMRGRRPGRW